MKQEERILEVFLSKLKDIKIVFDKETSEINKNVSKTPVSGNYHALMFSSRWGTRIPEQKVQFGH